MSDPQIQPAVTDCRPVICSGRLAFDQAVALFRNFQQRCSRTEVRLLDYAIENAPASLPLVVRILEEAGDISCILDRLTALFDATRDQQLQARLAQIIARHLPLPAAFLSRASLITPAGSWKVDAEAVADACVILDKLEDPRGRELIYCLLNIHQPAEFRRAGARALGKIASVSDASLLEQLARDADPVVETNARSALATLGITPAAPLPPRLSPRQ